MEETTVSVDSLVRRIELFIEDKNWDKGIEYCDRVLDIEPENAKVYLLMLLCKNQVGSLDELAELNVSVDSNSDYKNAYRFGNDEQRKALDSCFETIRDRENDEEYKWIQDKMSSVRSKNDMDNLIKKIEKLGNYKDSEQLLDKCKEGYKQLAEEESGNIYSEACRTMNMHTPGDVKNAKALFETITDYKDSKQKIEECDKRIESLEAELQETAKEAMFWIIAVLVAGVFLVIAYKMDLWNNLFPSAFSVEETEKIDEEEKSTKSSTSSGSSYSLTLSDDDKLLCWLVTEEYVESQLKNPSSAKFPSYYLSSDITYSKSGNNVTVKSYVDAENSFGGTVRTYFTIVIEIKDGKNRVVSFAYE